MPTYAQYRADAERRARRAAQDRALAARHRAFDLSAQDTHVKSERFHFAVVGEGSATSHDAFRRGWDRTFSKERA